MGDENNIFSSGDNSLLDRFIGILDRQSDTKLAPNQLMGFLSLFNLLGILNIVQGSVDTGFKDISALASLTSLSNQIAKTPEEPTIKDTLMGLLGAQNQSNPDLGGLLNMIGGGGNKKINPQMLLTLLSLLNSQFSAGKSDQSGPKNDTAKEEGQREPAVEQQKDKERNVELKYDKKKTS